MQASDIATALVNNTQQPIDAKDVNLTVHIVSMLNKYVTCCDDDVRK